MEAAKGIVSYVKAQKRGKDGMVAETRPCFDIQTTTENNL